MKKENTFKNIFYAVKTIIATCPHRLFLDIISEMVDYGIYLFLDIIFLGHLLRMCEERRMFSEVVVFISISMAVIFGGMVFLSWYRNRYSLILEQTTKEKLNRKLYKKAADVDIVCFENTAFFDRYTRTSSEFFSTTLGTYNEAKNVVISILANFTVILIIVNIDPFALLFGIVPLISGKLFGKRISKLRFDLKAENTPHERKASYSERIVYLQDYAKELRLFRVFSLIKRNFAEGINELLNNITRYGKKIALMEFLRNVLIGNGVYFSVILYLTLRAMLTDYIGAADWLILLNASTVFIEALQSLSNNIQRIREQAKDIVIFREFFNYIPQISEGAGGSSIVNGDHTLCLDNVSFTYSGQTVPVLENINFTINAGEKIAIVGHNGAGKSTLVKLILRFYDPDKGRITLDGMDIKTYAVKSYRNIFGTVMQDFKLFAFSIAENVILRQYDKSCAETVNSSLEKSNFCEKLHSLKDGVETMLTREFDDNGTVLSEGEAQKIAVSRIFARESDIIILDEPSSALDPIAENKMFETMLKACENKSVIFISHRLSSATLADRIYVMENGRIVESGNHYDLINKNGMYADMFSKQAENYIAGRVVKQ